jgi:hypothetical protein
LFLIILLIYWYLSFDNFFVIRAAVVHCITIFLSLRDAKAFEAVINETWVILFTSFSETLLFKVLVLKNTVV